MCREREREKERKKREGMERLYHMYIIVSNVPERCVCTSKIKMLYYCMYDISTSLQHLECGQYNQVGRLMGVTLAYH